MKTETKKFATYQNASFDRGVPVEVTDERDAVQKAGKNVRFTMYEQTFSEIDGETLAGEPKNHTPYIYTNIDAILSVEDVIAEKQAELAAEQASTLSDEFSGLFSVPHMKRFIAELQTINPATCYIKEPSQYCQFIRLDEGEKVYNAQGQQLHPAPAQDVAPDVTPAL